MSLFRKTEKYPSTKHLVADIPFSNNQINININMNNNFNENVKNLKTSNYNINIISTMTKLVNDKDVFFIKNNEKSINEKSINNIKNPKIILNSFSQQKINLDKEITKKIQNEDDYEKIYELLSNQLKD